MKKPLRSSVVLIAVIGVIYVIYILAFLSSLRNLPSNVLVDLALYPSDISAEWKFVPSIDTISFDTLKSRDRDIVKTEFSGLGYTLYSGALGYRYVNSDPKKPRPRSEEMRAIEITKMLHDKGIRIGNPVDSAGCSSVHQAILADDVTSARLLLSLEGITDIPGNADATYKACKSRTTELAKARELPIE